MRDSSVWLEVELAAELAAELVVELAVELVVVELWWSTASPVIRYRSSAQRTSA